jgi:hypothetical protein
MWHIPQGGSQQVLLTLWDFACTAVVDCCVQFFASVFRWYAKKKSVRAQTNYI